MSRSSYEDYRGVVFAKIPKSEEEAMSVRDFQRAVGLPSYVTAKRWMQRGAKELGLRLRRSHARQGRAGPEAVVFWGE